jgi:DNA-binding response OmpR family regulator
VPLRSRILFVESTPDIARAVASMLERHEFEVTRSDDDRQAAERLKKDRFDVLIVEVKAVPEDPGLRFLRHVNDNVPHLSSRIVVISGDDSAAVKRELDVLGVCDVVHKPVHETEILTAIRECLDSTPATVH